MDHYIAYHSVDLMGHDYPRFDNDFGHYSRKPEAFLQKTIGNLVWVVVGKRTGKQIRYRLAGVYSPNRVTAEEDNWLIEGPGRQAVTERDITDEPWFAELLREQNKFSFGMNRIRNPDVIAALTSLAPESSELAPVENSRSVRAIDGRAEVKEPSFTYDEAFPVIAQMIMLAARVEPEKFAPHDVIVDLLLADETGAAIVARARSNSSWADNREVASNMVAWFSQQISIGRSEWLELFERERIEGAWAYRPTSLVSSGAATDISVIEGEPRMFFHFRRERGQRIVTAKRAAARNQHGHLECEACGFAAQLLYAGFDGDVAEVHHRQALADSSQPVETKLDDLAILCANCHRAIHQTRPLMSVEMFREHFLNARRSTDAV